MVKCLACSDSGISYMSDDCYGECMECGTRPNKKYLCGICDQYDDKLRYIPIKKNTRGICFDCLVCFENIRRVS